MELMPHSMRRRRHGGGGGGQQQRGGRYAVVDMAGLDDSGGRSTPDGEGLGFNGGLRIHIRVWRYAAIDVAGLDDSGGRTTPDGDQLTESRCQLHSGSSSLATLRFRIGTVHLVEPVKLKGSKLAIHLKLSISTAGRRGVLGGLPSDPSFNDISDFSLEASDEGDSPRSYSGHKGVNAWQSFNSSCCNRVRELGLEASDKGESLRSYSGQEGMLWVLGSPQQT